MGELRTTACMLAFLSSTPERQALTATACMCMLQGRSVLTLGPPPLLGTQPTQPTFSSKQQTTSSWMAGNLHPHFVICHTPDAHIVLFHATPAHPPPTSPRMQTTSSWMAGLPLVTQRLRLALSWLPQRL